MKRLLQLLLPFLFVYSILNPAAASAVPNEATLFPDSARIVDVSTVKLLPDDAGTSKAVITLPGQMIPDSLSAVLPAGSPFRILDQSWRQISRQDDARLADLRSQVQDLKTERIGIVAGIQALETKIQFWQAQAKARVKTVEDAATLSALIAKSVKMAFQEKLTLEPDLQKVENRIKELQDEINRIAGQKESLWEVTFLIGGPAGRETSLIITYSLTGCGWNPLYRLEAHPRERVITFEWEAEVWQSSGIDWSQVETNLATLPPRSAISPPLLPPWVVRPRQAIPLKGRSKADFRDAPAAGAVMFSASPEAEPQEVRKTTFSLWNLGKRNIAAGARQRIKVRSEKWPALFVHILRPSLIPQSFVQASVKLPEAREIPVGQATFLIDGAVLGKRPFSFAGSEGQFSFGSDPLVTGETLLLSRKSGERGFIADRQSHEWAMRFDLRNNRDSAINVRMEDPLPQTRDERIKAILKFEPEPTEKSVDSSIWITELPAGQKKSITATILIEAPKEMDLDLGWRR